MNRRALLAAFVAAPVAAALAAPGTAFAGHGHTRPFPPTLKLPDGFCPDGIARGSGSKAFVGSLKDGAIVCLDLRTGECVPVVDGVAGTQATGLEVVNGRIWAGCGEMGAAAVFDDTTGTCLAKFDFDGGYVNDNTATRSAIFFTDSEKPCLYCVALPASGALPGPDAVTALPLPRGLGDAGAFNNGIAAAWNGMLIIVQSEADRLWCFDPTTGKASRINTGNASVADGDGLLLRGRTLYVVRNRRNVISKFRLNDRLTKATLVDHIADHDLDIPSTITAFGDHLYAVNARLTTPPTASTRYSVVRVRD